MIGIQHAQNVDSELVESLKAFFEDEGVQVKVQASERGTYAAIEWALPALLTLWITKSYFDGFLKEMGKDSAQSLKQLIKAAYTKLRKTPNRVCDADEMRRVADGAPIESVGRLGPAINLNISVSSADDGSKTINFVFPSGLNDLEVDMAVTSSFEEVLPTFQHCDENQPSESEDKFRERLVYDSKLGWLTAFDMAMKEAKESSALRSKLSGTD